MDLQNPEKKMSKSSDNPNGYILMRDEPEVIRRKLSRAVTDSVGVVNYSDDQPGVKNLLTIMAAISGREIDSLVNDFKNVGYKEFKEACADMVIKELTPIREKINDFMTVNKSELEGILREGADKAEYQAQKTLRKMQKKIGLVPRYK